MNWKILDKKPAKAEELCRGIVEMSHEDIDNALTELQQKGLVDYRTVDDRWELKT